MEQTLEHRIRERAYEIWHANGCADGNANEHWLAAEREVLSASLALTVASEATATCKAKSPNRAARRAKLAKSPAAA